MTSKPKSDVNADDAGAGRPATRARSAAAKKTTAKAGPPRAEGDGLARLSADELNAMISRAAYLRAERRGFAPGHEVEDWLAAEAEIRAKVSGGSQEQH